jgi:hypothetical protein
VEVQLVRLQVQPLVLVHLIQLLVAQLLTRLAQRQSLMQHQRQEALTQAMLVKVHQAHSV